LYAYDLIKKEEFPVYAKSTVNGVVYTYDRHVVSPDGKLIAVTYRYGTQKEVDACEMSCPLKAGVQIYDIATRKVVRDFKLPVKASVTAWVGDGLFASHWVWEGQTHYSVFKSDGTDMGITGGYTGDFSPDKSMYFEMASFGMGYGGPEKVAYVVDIKTLKRRQVMQGKYYNFEGWIDDRTVRFQEADTQQGLTETSKRFTYNVVTGEKKEFTPTAQPPANDPIRVDNMEAASIQRDYLKQDMSYVMVNGKVLATGGTNLFVIK
jgi:hypothetical protein